MTLKLNNTLTRTIENFVPIDDQKATLYTCGPTVYDYLTVGNWVPYIYWDTLVRVLIAEGYNVERVMNITDVGHLVSDEDAGEDKLEKGARREGKSAWDVAEFYAEDFLQGIEKLGLIMPEHVVRATDFIPQQLDLIRILKDKGFTYQIDDGIYFDTSKFPTYANFAQLHLEAQKAGARIEFNPEKRHPSDFALWKFTPHNEKRDMEWDTPADLFDGVPIRKGFPGWHLECSAMAMSILGPTIDIHTGGIDHIPVHHTNEIAQSESASGQTFAHYWLHNNHLKVNGTKISKSLNNGYTLQDLAKKGFDPLDYRMFVLQSHYTNEGNFTFENLEGARNRLRHWKNIAALRHQTHDTLLEDSDKLQDDKVTSLLGAIGTIKEALRDDLDTPAALRTVDEAFSKLDGTPLKSIHQHGLTELLETVDQLLGLQLISSTPDIDDTAKRLILDRQYARDNKEWKQSDKIRDKLLDKKIFVRDTPTGSIWEYTD